jgi:hypothetical protein
VIPLCLAAGEALFCVQIKRDEREGPGVGGGVLDAVGIDDELVKEPGVAQREGVGAELVVGCEGVGLHLVRGCAGEQQVLRSAQDDNLDLEITARNAEVDTLRLLQQLGLVLRSERLHLGDESGLCGCLHWRRGCGAGCDRHADLGEELFLAGGRADAEQADGLVAEVVELVWRVGRDVDSLAGFDDGFCATEGGLHLAFEEDEGLFKVVAMGWWAAAGRDVHVDEAEAAGGVLAGEQDSVGVADEADVRLDWVVCVGEGEGACEVVGWER